MSEQQKPKHPIKSLEELRDALDKSEEVIVDSSGSVYRSNDPQIVNTPPQKRTAVKPQRWFALPASGGRYD